MPVLSAADLQFFQDNGYVLARSVISKEQAASTAAEVWAFDGRADAAPWAEPARPGAGEMYHGQRQWENRTAPRVPPMRRVDDGGEELGREGLAEEVRELLHAQCLSPTQRGG